MILYRLLPAVESTKKEEQEPKSSTVNRLISRWHNAFCENLQQQQQEKRFRS